jgi:hypothetical protein
MGWWGLLVAITAAGCGPGLIYNDTVEGTATIDGVPLARVHVQFYPETATGLAAPSSTALTDDQGRFKMICENQRLGAVVAKHDVVVLVGRDYDPATDGDNHGDADAARPPRPQVPACYTIVHNTPLQVDVTKDQHTYELKLTNGARPRTPAGN